MASYDFSDANKNEFKGYELEAGQYDIKLMKNAHESLSKVSLNVAETVKYETDEASGNAISNKFDDVSDVVTSDLKEKYLSRSDFTSTFPTTAGKISVSESLRIKIYQWQSNSNNNVADEGQPYFTETIPTTGVPSNLKLTGMIGLPYDDEKWDTYMNQLTQEKMIALVANKGYNSGINDTELGITETPNADGPAGFGLGAGSGSYNSWCSEVLLASTWNKDLSYEMGKLMGNQALWGNGGNVTRIFGWYAPACNTHRSAFGGRNFEYFSEDPLISGYMSAEAVKGAQDKGLLPYVKHFAINEQEY